MPAPETKGNNGSALNRARASLQNHVLPLSPLYPRSRRQLLTQDMLLACIDEALGIVEDIEHYEK
jgi:hypothetical protein